VGQAQTIYIPNYQLDRLAKPLIVAAAEYFSDPEVNKRFEEWKREREKEGVE